MSVHIVKLCVGATSVADLAAWQNGRTACVCGTRAWPKRAAEVVSGGSLYWVIGGAILVRQRIVAIDRVEDEFGERCGLYLDRDLIRTVPQPRRPFQGWRYLSASEAPADLQSAEALPDQLAAELSRIGAW